MILGKKLDYFSNYYMILGNNFSYLLIVVVKLLAVIAKLPSISDYL
jgi:hypothetical protein